MQRRTGVWREVERARWETGETQMAYAKRIGISSAQYINLISGKQLPGPKSLCALNRFFPHLRPFFAALFYGEENEDSVGQTSEAQE
jgi:DNA-binding XRE family transcriptional regulator